MASALRIDQRCFRRLAIADPIVIELREWSRIAEGLGSVAGDTDAGQGEPHPRGNPRKAP